MKRNVQIYVEGNRLELFNDEKINVNSSVQNIADISKVYTDFSQSFTIPASENNNSIFQYFYNSDYDGTINHNIRRDAYIEIDLTSFRRGKIQLEKANLKNGQVENYTITFYGDVLALKDKFGEDNLSQLDYSADSHEYTGAEVQMRVESSATDFDVCYPLISSQRVWQYDNATTPDDNIDTSLGAIKFNELLPAYRVRNIFEVIQSNYGVSFTGTFLSDPRFTSAYLWLKKSETPTFTSQATRIDFDYATYDSPEVTDYVQIDFINNSIQYYNQPQWAIGTTNYPAIHNIVLNIFGISDTDVDYWIDVYINNTLVSTIQGIGNASYNLITESNDPSIDNVVYFIMRAQSFITFTSQINSYYDVTLPSGAFTYQDYIIYNNTQSATAFVNLADLMPSMKVADFFAGTLKEFNLTCYGISENTFQLEPLEDWYGKGQIIDITQHTIVENIDIERIKLYRTIRFKYQDSLSFMNVQFNQFFNRQYGNLDYSFPYDGEEYSIESPFENMMFNRFTNEDIQVGYALGTSPEFKPYVPKPMILYKFGGISTNTWYFDNGTTIDALNSYVCFGQDLQVNGIDYSLNWGAETSTLTNTPISNSLFETYYFNYIINLFNRKNRLTYIKANLPITILTSLKLNDRLVIRDKRYIINEMKSDLTSGEVDFTLINDFRTLAPLRRVGATIGVGGTSVVNVAVPLKNGTYKATIDITGTGVISVSDTEIFEDRILEFILPENTNEIFILITEEAELLITEEAQQLVNEEGKELVYTIPITYEYNDGTSEIRYLQIIQAG
jgi:hypothetical protein